MDELRERLAEALFKYEHRFGDGSLRPWEERPKQWREEVYFRKADAILPIIQAETAAALRRAADGGCYCACHSPVSSRPTCVHCRPDAFVKTHDPYCGLTAGGVAKILSLITEPAGRALEQVLEKRDMEWIKAFGAEDLQPRCTPESLAKWVFRDVSFGVKDLELREAQAAKDEQKEIAAIVSQEIKQQEDAYPKWSTNEFVSGRLHGLRRIKYLLEQRAAARERVEKLQSDSGVKSRTREGAV